MMVRLAEERDFPGFLGLAAQVEHWFGPMVEDAGFHDAVRDHIGAIFANWPDLAFRGRRLYAREGLVVSEWTATATDGEGRRLEWDGIDVFPFENGLILRKDVYSAGHRPRVLDG